MQYTFQSEESTEESESESEESSTAAAAGVSDADEAEDEVVDDDIEQRGDDLDKESVSNFRDTIIVSNSFYIS